MTEIDRRAFVGTVAAAASLPGIAAASAPQREPGAKFGMHFAPHFGMGKHHAGDDPIAQLEYFADQGFTALEDNWMSRRPVEEQERIAKTMSRLGMTMGVFVAHADFGSVTFATRARDARSRLEDEMRNAVDAAKRVNAKWCTVVPGKYEPRVAWDYQTAYVVDNLKRCAEICEPAGLVMVLEPLNPRDHPGLFLTRIPQAYQVCRAVGSPSCKILNDLYHQQVTEGNLIPNIDAAWDEIAYFQIGDNPGRQEPGTGEINYANVFRHIKNKGFKGILGMEHGVSGGGKEGEQALIAAYRAADPG